MSCSSWPPLTVTAVVVISPLPAVSTVSVMVVGSASLPSPSCPTRYPCRSPIGWFWQPSAGGWAHRHGTLCAVLFAELASASQRLAATTKRSEKAAVLVDLLRRLAPDEIDVAVGILTGAPRQGRIGVGWATLRDVQVAPAARADPAGQGRRCGHRATGVDVGQRRQRGAPGPAERARRSSHRSGAAAAVGRARRRAAPRRPRRRDGRRRRQGRRRADQLPCAAPT